jgi:hypothetical protein
MSALKTNSRWSPFTGRFNLLSSNWMKRVVEDFSLFLWENLTIYPFLLFLESLGIFLNRDDIFTIKFIMNNIILRIIHKIYSIFSSSLEHFF